MSKPKVLVTHPEIEKSVIDLLRISCDVTICEGLPEPSRQEILNKAKGMDGILWATHSPLNAEALDAIGPQLRALSAKSAGIDYIDVAEVKRRGIPLGYTPGVLNNAVADIAVGLLVGAARRFHEGRRKIENNQWEQGRPTWMLGQDIGGSTVGIVGLGGIGQSIVKRLKGFEVGQFVYTGHQAKKEGDELGAKFLSFDELLRTSDFVVAACPLNNETAGLFNANTFGKMKTTSVFVNIARGGVVVQEDLIDALRTNKIFAAGLDVVTPEPLPANHPLLELDNCVLLPHLGSATVRTRENMGLLAAHNVLRGLAGEPLQAPAY